MPRTTTADLAETVAALQQVVIDLQQQIQRDVIDRLDVINGRLESSLVRAVAADVPKPAVPVALQGTRLSSAKNTVTLASTMGRFPYEVSGGR